MWNYLQYTVEFILSEINDSRSFHFTIETLKAVKIASRYSPIKLLTLNKKSLWRNNQNTNSPVVNSSNLSFRIRKWSRASYLFKYVIFVQIWHIATYIKLNWCEIARLTIEYIYDVFEVNMYALISKLVYIRQTSHETLNGNDLIDTSIYRLWQETIIFLYRIIINKHIFDLNFFRWQRIILVFTSFNLLQITAHKENYFIDIIEDCLSKTYIV